MLAISVSEIWRVITHFMVTTPVFTLFFCLAIGYWVGQVHLFRGFQMGATVGTLLTTLIVGQVGAFPRDAMLGTIFFGMFMFAVGYRIGPSFLASMRVFGGRMATLGIVWLLVAFLVAWALFAITGTGPGVGAGTIAGALTQSATVASSLQTLGELPAHGGLRATYEAQLPIAYALTYVFGTLGVIILLRDLAPKMLGIQIAEQGQRMAQKYHFQVRNPNPTWRRTYQLAAKSPLVGRTIREFNQFFSNRLIALAAFHEGAMTDHLDYQLAVGDRVTVIGYAPHFDDLKDIPGIHEVLTPTNALRERQFVLGKHFHLGQLVTLRQHGVFVNLYDPLSGNDHLINQLQPGDVIALTGNTSVTAPLLKEMGRWHSSATAINYVVFALGIAGASLLGLVGFQLNGIPLTLGNGTAALIMGLILASWVDRHRTHATIPPTVTAFMQSFGLTLFVGSVGLSSAQQFTAAIKSLGVGVLIIGAVLSIVPHLVTLLFGHFVMKVEPLALIAALCGAGTSAATMNEVTHQAGLEGGAYVAAAFTPAFVIGNIGITFLGPIFVALLA